MGGFPRTGEFKGCGSEGEESRVTLGFRAPGGLLYCSLSQDPMEVPAGEKTAVRF